LRHLLRRIVRHDSGSKRFGLRIVLEGAPSHPPFIAGVVPPDYLIDGLITRRFCWSITAPTETDKTAVALLLSPCLAPGQSIGEYQVERGLNSIRHVGASVLGLIQATMPSKGPR
jgi:hypothetical protein